MVHPRECHGDVLTPQLALDERNVKRLNEALKNWSSYVAEAPTTSGWEKEWLLGFAPCVVLVRSGQNLDIEPTDDPDLEVDLGEPVSPLDVQAQTFDSLVNWDEVRCFSFSVVHKLRFVVLPQALRHGC